MKTQINKQHANVVAVQPQTNHKEDRMKNTYPTLFARQGATPRFTSPQRASMHCLSTIVALAISILLLGSICSAQLQNDYIPYWSSGSFADSIMSQTSPTQIYVTGNLGLNSYSDSYGLGGTPVLSANGSHPIMSLSVGNGACSVNNGSSANTCVGEAAGADIMPTGNVNTYVGFAAGDGNTSGAYNVGVGTGALGGVGAGTANTSVGAIVVSIPQAAATPFSAITPATALDRKQQHLPAAAPGTHLIGGKQ